MRLTLTALTLSALLAAAPASAKTESAVLAGGCFWGMESVFEHVKGVTNVVSGYAGGARSDATYDIVSSETSDHAEAVRISYDPDQISYVQLLQIYFTVAHDPTQLNRQGPDVGKSYRSAIFPQNAAQTAAAQAFIARLNQSRKIATRIERGAFFPAEAYHQDYARRHPNFPYIVINDRPKVAALKQQYPNLYHD